MNKNKKRRNNETIFLHLSDLHFSDLEFKEAIKEKWAYIFHVFYEKSTLLHAKRSLETLLADLVERRKRIDKLICDVEFLKGLVDKTKCSYEQYEELYKEIVDEVLGDASADICFLIACMALHNKTDDELCPDELDILINYRISAGIKDFLDSHQTQEPYNLRELNYKFYSYFCSDNKIYSRLYQRTIIQNNNTLYDKAFDKQQIDLGALADEEKANLSLNTRKSEIYSDLFRSILSRYIFLWREKNHVTQNELSKKSGVDRTMIAKVEKLQQTASLDTTIKLLNAVGANLVIVPHK